MEIDNLNDTERNRQRSYYLMETDNSYSTERNRQHCSYLRPWTAIFITVIALLGGFIGGVVYQQYMVRKEFQSPPSQSRQIGNMEIQYEPSDIDLRINTNGSCVAPSCFQCRAEVRLQKVYDYQPKHCQPDPKVINGTCFQCGNECKMMEDLIKAPTNGLRCPRPVSIDCCNIVQMGNLLNICGQGGKYVCHKDKETSKDEHVCQCPPGRQGDRCQETAEEPVVCKCYRGMHKFCGEEEMIGCNSDHVPSGWLQCHMSLNKGGEHMNCVCNRMKAIGEMDQDIDSFQNCSVPRKEALTTNVSSRMTESYIVMFLIATMPYIAYGNG